MGKESPFEQQEIPFIPPDVVPNALCYGTEGLTEKKLHKNEDGVTYSDEEGSTFEWRSLGPQSGYYITRTAESPEVKAEFEKLLNANPNHPDKEFLKDLAKQKVRSRNRAAYLQDQKKKKKSGKGKK